MTVWGANRRIKMNGIVDRFEGEIVVIEIDGVMQDFSKSIVEPSVQAGDSVNLIDGKWVTNKVETENRTKKIKELMNNIWED
jgi:hypothetical protein